MKNSVLPGISLAILTSITLILSSCKDDEPPAKPIVSFAKETRTVAESAGTVTVEVKLDKPAPKDLTIEYSVDGTALDIEQSGSAATSDYNITGGTGELDIAAGESSGTIEININPDNIYEDDETIILSLDDAGTDATITTEEDDRTVTITIGNDDDKFVASITTAPMTVNEDDYETIIEVQVQLDRAPQTNVKVNYALTGTAIDTLYASNQGYPGFFYDYYVNSTTHGEVTIKAGQTTATIPIKILPDYNFENAETIIVTLADGGSNSVNIGDNDATTITVEQQDGEVIALSWDSNAADMDLFVWFKQDADYYYLTASNFAGTDPATEFLIIPSIVTEGVTSDFGASFTYYDGTADPLNFEVQYGQVTDGVLEPRADRDIFNATYTATNKNKWDQQGAASPAIAQTFSVTDGVYGNFSAITVPTTGSRMKNPIELKNILKKRASNKLVTTAPGI